MILQVTAKICCTELLMFYFICSARAILVQGVPYFLRVSQTIHCLIAENNYFSLQLYVSLILQHKVRWLILYSEK